ILENPLTAPSDKRITILTLFNNFVSRLTNYMTKTVYDSNNSGVVDNAEKLGGQTASYYTKTANITDSTDKRFVTDT
ncbi:hypothetical protein, partial [Pantoea agglomerans]|uniref:hypothetical protein n=1 Tax=Enterobacter agglomerans TaxID=549 RepID=UPI002B1E3CD4